MLEGSHRFWRYKKIQHVGFSTDINLMFNGKIWGCCQCHLALGKKVNEHIFQNYSFLFLYLGLIHLFERPATWKWPEKLSSFFCSNPHLQMDRIQIWCNDDRYILCFQSDVMQLTEDTTKLKLFMDVLDGTKAAVSHHGRTYFPFLISHLSFMHFSAFFLLTNSFRLFQLTTPMSVPCLRLGSMMATLLLILLKQWRRWVFMHLMEMVYRFP